MRQYVPFMETPIISSPNITKAFYALQEKEESVLLSQLSELISRNILIIEKTEPVIVKDDDPNFPNRLHIKQSIRLVSREMEYIRKLESQIKRLEDELQELKERAQASFF